MWTNYLKIAFRNLRRQKGYALINILGLAVGLATCLVIGYYIQHELSYDRFHTNADRLYRVTRGNYAITPPGTQQLLADNFPEIENVTFVDSRGERLLSTGNEPLYIEEVLKTNHRFFHVFPYRLLRGHPDDVLDGPGKIVLTRSAARRLFDQENPVGQVVTYENSQEYQVSGIVENPPSNTHFRFNALLSLSQKEREARLTGPVRWNFYDGYTYLDLRKNADPQALQAKIDRFTENLDTKYETTLSLQPVTDIHLHATDIGGEIAAQSDI